MAAKLKFATVSGSCTIEIEDDVTALIFKVDTPDLDAELVFDYETAIAMRNQIDLLLKIIEPLKPRPNHGT